MTSTCFWGCVPMPRSQRGLRGIGAMVKLHRIHAVCSSIPHWDSNHLVRLYLWGVTSNGGGTPSCIIQQEVVMDDPSWTRWPAPGTPGTTFFQLQLWVPCRCSTRPWNEPQLISTLTLLKKATKICGLKDSQTKKIHELKWVEYDSMSCESSNCSWISRKEKLGCESENLLRTGRFISKCVDLAKQKWG